MEQKEFRLSLHLRSRKLILAHDMRASLLWEYPCLNFKTLAFAAVR